MAIPLRLLRREEFIVCSFTVGHRTIEWWDLPVNKAGGQTRKNKGVDPRKGHVRLIGLLPLHDSRRQRLTTCSFLHGTRRKCSELPLTMGTRGSRRMVRVPTRRAAPSSLLTT